MKRSQTKFHAHPMRESQVLRSKKVKIHHWVKIFLQHSFFSSSIFYWNYNNWYWYTFASL